MVKKQNRAKKPTNTNFVLFYFLFFSPQWVKHTQKNHSLCTFFFRVSFFKTRLLFYRDFSLFHEQKTLYTQLPSSCEKKKKVFCIPLSHTKGKKNYSPKTLGVTRLIFHARSAIRQP